MKISLAITSHDEGYLLRNLLNLVEPFTYENSELFEIVIVDDFSTDEITLASLSLTSVLGTRVIEHSLNGDFAAHKNFLNAQCSGDWILQLDADEWIDTNLLSHLPAIIEQNQTVEAYWFPRVNTVDGLTLRHVQKWGWVLSTLPEYITVQQLDTNGEFYALLRDFNYIIKEEDGFVQYYEPIVMWPDPQMRLYKNDPKIRWEGKVHERIVGYDNFSRFPDDVFYAIRHHKEILRQEKQNSFYEELMK